MATIRSSVLALSLLAAACGGSGDGGTTGPASVLAPPPAGQGVQIKLTTPLDANSEGERCLFYRVPADGLYVNREEVRYTTGVHHVMLWRTPYADIPTVNIWGEAVDTSGVFDCMMGAIGDWRVDGVAGGAQAAQATPAVDGLPSDTALKLEGGSVLLVGASFMNAGKKPLTPEIDINLYTVPAGAVTREAGLLFLYDPFIYLPGESIGWAHERCPIGKDVTLVNAQSHMHARGYQFVANLLDPEGTERQEIFSTQTWQNVVSKPMDPPLPLAAGQMIDFQCSYRNNEARTVYQGGMMMDEMCFFLGLYYPRDIKTELCSATDDASGRSLGASWIGSGAADGALTATCLRGAYGPSGVLENADECVVDACPAISTAVSNAVRCLASAGVGPCAGACGATDPTTCPACLADQCAEAMAALTAATCA